ncbi:hypothetical protein PAI11_33170 [Patulibacter medicamentivorans]|uniref:Cell wall-binding repeat-containing protein n=1 Tax=Patulibacter medicamentivorans TaxID=1097667 RepID=H0E903_9ACTN|nr:hypothetical protein [Patulibacter medicamentivorans]EHN09856.1 hypothetical protein PAI11_33170 [Patulibacter medicamentivorans]
MHPERLFPRRRHALAATSLTLLALAGCGGDDSSGGSPFGGTPKASQSSSATDLGFPIVATRNTTRTASDDPVAGAAAIARAIYSGGAAETQARAVALVDRRDWRAALAATSLMAKPIGAPILFSDGANLPKTTTEALEALRPAGSEPAGGAQVFRVGAVGRPAGLRTNDIDGTDPAALALAIDRITAAARRRASDSVLVVSAERPEFAVPAAAWAAKSGDPIAFVTKAGIPAATRRQLADHPRATIFVLGPSNVIPPAVTKQLRRYGTVRRTGGADPISNAIGFAKYGSGSFGWHITGAGHGFEFARSNAPLMAITLAPLAATGLHGPLLLLDSADKLPEPVRGFLLDFQPGIPSTGDPADGYYNRGWLAGSTDAISPQVQSQIDALLEISPINDRAPAPEQTATSESTPTTPITPTTTTGPTPPGRTTDGKKP